MTDVDNIQNYEESDEIQIVEQETPSFNSHQENDESKDVQEQQQDHFSLMLLNKNEEIIIRGDGNLTVFGIFNHFSNEFPSSKLNSKLAPEEYKSTINNINLILKKELANKYLKHFLFISLCCCCCTFGCSLIPIVYMNKKAKLAINKYLMLENERIYKRLGLKWRLCKHKFNNNTLSEYVILIEVLDKVKLYNPD